MGAGGGLRVTPQIRVVVRRLGAVGVLRLLRCGRVLCLRVCEYRDLFLFAADGDVDVPGRQAGRL
eukprot:4588201-Alexandrium_andersonii.AAC.1